MGSPRDTAGIITPRRAWVKGIRIARIPLPTGCARRQSRCRALLPAGRPEMAAVLLLVPLAIIIVLALILTTGTFFMVEQAQVALIERFGRFDRIASAGLNTKIPLI